VRIWQHYGKPFIANWEPGSGFRWWQDPGFHTSADYLRIGGALARPIYNIALSVPDMLYATLFGDALLGGPISSDFPPPWSFHLMSTGYLLAVIPMTCLVVGIAVAIARIIRRFDVVWSMLLAILLGVVAAIVLLTIRVPHFGSAKAAYALAAIIPLCALLALGTEWLAFGSRRASNIIVALILVFALNSYATYWINSGDASVLAIIGERRVATGEREQGEALLHSAVQIDPNNVRARLALARHLTNTRQFAAARKWLDLAPAQPDSAVRHMLLAQIESYAGQTRLAQGELDRAIELDPYFADAYIARAELARASGDIAGAVEAHRDALAINPYVEAIHRLLAGEYEAIGDSINANRHRHYVELLRSLPKATKKKPAS
jgi:tetratricopeptide (TPR) repeat protein